MRLRIRSFSLSCFLLLAPAVVAACAGSDGGSDSGARLSVVATVYPLGYFAERIGGDLVDVDVLVGPGMAAHGFDPTASDLQALAAADVILMNGLGLEPWLQRALDALGAGASGTLVEAADEALAMKEEARERGEDHAEEGEHDELDPHIWLDPTLAVHQVERIRDALAAADAASADAYRQGADELIAELLVLHKDFVNGLGACRHNRFVASHAAYGYLAARYAAEQIPIAGLSAEAEPSPQRLAEIVDQVTALGLGHLLVEPVRSDRLPQTIARETGIALVPIHAIGSVTEDELDTHGDYFGLMRDNLTSLRLALECS